MTGTDLAIRTEKLVERVESPEVRDRIEALLPDTIPYTRFASVAKTAIRSRPELAGADERTLLGALVRCAQDGLMPDGREAAINVYRSKVKNADGSDGYIQKAEYLPMIAGLRKNLAEFGWTLKTRCVYTGDDFEYVEEPQSIRHTPARPGVERGQRRGAYAVATHRDGRRVQIFLDEAEIAKRRAKAKTDKVWQEHPDPMAEKSAGHAIFDEIPRAERDRMIVPTDNGVDQAVELLYGPDGDTFTAIEAPAGHPSDGGEPQPEAHTEAEAPDTVGDETPQAAASSSAEGVAVPGTDDGEPQAPWVTAGDTLVDGGQWDGKTLAQIAAIEGGDEWLAYALNNPAKFDEAFNENVAAFVAGAFPAEASAA